MAGEKKTIKQRIEELKIKTAQLYIAIRSPKTPWYAKAIGFLTLAYALSPIDLIPDFIPILGYLDDLIILPLLVSLCIKLIPNDIWIESEEKARTIWLEGKPVKWYYAIPIVIIWILVLFWLGRLLFNAIL